MRTLSDREVQSILPQKPPFLFVDHILNYEEGKFSTGDRLLREEEWFFAGHYPQMPVFPGFLQAEAMGQCASVALFTMDKFKGKSILLLESQVQLYKKVIPGDRLLLKTSIDKIKGTVVVYHGEAYVNEDLVSSASFKSIIVKETLFDYDKNK